MASLPDSLAITATKNEGPFLLQWIAWQKAIGFERILVMHNDCTDFSARLLKLLEAHGVLTQLRHDPAPDQPPQRSAFDAAFAHPLTQAAAWVMISDVDERLVIHVGDGTLGALVEEGAMNALGMNINWRIFGTQGEEQWSDRILHRHFTRAAHTDAQQNVCFKTLFRRPQDWDHLGAHGPKGWRGGGRWNTRDIRMLLADGTVSPAYVNKNWAKNATERAEVTHERAQINHYALQSAEQFARKKGVPSASTLTNRYNGSFFQRFDRNEVADNSAARHDEAFETSFRALLSIEGVEALHHRCCVAYLDELAASRGRDVRADPRYDYHVERSLQFRRLVKRSMAAAAG